MNSKMCQNISNPPDDESLMRTYFENELNGYEHTFEQFKRRGKYAKLDYIRGRIDAVKAALEILTICERSA